LEKEKQRRFAEGLMGLNQMAAADADSPK